MVGGSRPPQETGELTREEGVEAVISSPDSLVAGHLAVRLDPVLQAVELPAGVANLDPSLADVNTDALSLKLNILSDNKYHVKPVECRVWIIQWLLLCCMCV